MFLALSLLTLQTKPALKPAEIMKAVTAQYRALKTMECSYKTTNPVSKKEIYSGTISYRRNHHMNFTITDVGEECTAGEDLDAKGKGNTWVTPADQRGYNDTLMDRQPYLLVRFIRDETKGNLGGGWLDNFETIKKGKKTFWRIRSNDDSDLALTIDSTSYLITEIASAEGYHPRVRLTTFVHYGK